MSCPTGFVPGLIAVDGNINCCKKIQKPNYWKLRVAQTGKSKKKKKNDKKRTDNFT